MTKNQIDFTLNSTTIAFANSLRRILLSEIPSVAFDIVFVKKNTTVLPDEFIVHRVGLIPIHYNDDTPLLFPEECGCDSFCDRCSLTYELNDFNSTNDVQELHTDKLLPQHSRNNIKLTETFLGKLARGHEISITAIARKGIAKDNAKWGTVNIVEFQYDNENKLRHTKYWHEENVENEWPGVQEEIMDPKLNNIPIYMSVEVNEGHKVSNSVKEGLKVMNKKIVDLIELINNYDEK